MQEAAPLSPRGLLLKLLTSPEELAQLQGHCQRLLQVGWPNHGNTLFLWHTLRIVGVPVPYGMTPQDQFVLLQASGHRILGPGLRVMPTDIYVSSRTMELGFVVGVGSWERGTFLGVNHRSQRVEPVERDATAWFLDGGFT